MTRAKLKKADLGLTAQDAQRIRKLEKTLDYEFRDTALLVTALTHRSYIAERKKLNVTDNQRLEWLGDSVLGLVVTEFLYERLPESDEGVLSKLKSQLVSKTALARMAKAIKLSEYIFLGKGEDETGGRDRESILSDALESLIGAMYLDNGFPAAKSFILRFHESEMTRVMTSKQMKD